MNSDSLQSARQVAELLGVSPSTLRRWCKVFSPYLSASGGGFSPDGVRRGYTQDDVRALERIKELLKQGLGYEEIAARLGKESSQLSVVSAEAPMPMTALSESFQAIAKAQRAILDSQQVNRDLLGVVIQDNFNLKEENARLRERMLRLEQELADLRKRDARYAALEEKVKGLEQAQYRADHRGWLARFFGF